MTVGIVVDMNLSVEWIPLLEQVRGQRVLPEHMGPVVLAALKQYETELSAAALVVVEQAKNRVRVLPL